jgi:uncharacterized protein involved in exopolysaccharide biosynthesis
MEKLSNTRKREEIDLVELIRRLWERRAIILKIAGAVTAAGILVALLGEVKYAAGSVIVPQTGYNAPGGNIQGLAALAGINVSRSEQGDLLSPLIYPMVVGSVPFQRELMHTGVSVPGHDAPVTLLAYFTERDYRRFSFFPFLARYTIGLPALIVRALRGRADTAAPAGEIPDVETLTAAEWECLRILSQRMAVAVDEKNGYIILTATMPTALMAAQTAARAQELLQQYVTGFKLQKARANLEFIEARYAELKADFETSRQALASFQDANRSITSAVARIRESSLENEYDLAFSIYSELARQREQAGIKVKEDTPVFTVVEPVTVPLRRVAPRRMTITFVSVLLGLVAGVGFVFVKDYLAVSQ